ncbi:MAG: hypothetical protein KAF27_06970 [Porphyrobacter sp.]|nr:hypothetical protein [Porphyrobacter sp.]
MKTALTLSAFATLAFLAAPALADDAKANEGTARSRVKPARLIEFTGNREFLKESSRLRVWRGEVGYTLSVNAAGTPIECKLTEEFRMNYVNSKLCEVLLRTHSFEPAQDASGTAVAGTYEGRLNYLEMREKE